MLGFNLLFCRLLVLLCFAFLFYHLFPYIFRAALIKKKLFCIQWYMMVIWCFMLVDDLMSLDESRSLLGMELEGQANVAVPCTPEQTSVPGCWDVNDPFLGWLVA